MKLENAFLFAETSIRACALQNLDLILQNDNHVVPMIIGHKSVQNISMFQSISKLDVVPCGGRKESPHTHL